MALLTLIMAKVRQPRAVENWHWDSAFQWITLELVNNIPVIIIIIIIIINNININNIKINYWYQYQYQYQWIIHFGDEYCQHYLSPWLQHPAGSKAMKASHSRSQGLSMIFQASPGLSPAFSTATEVGIWLGASRIWGLDGQKLWFWFHGGSKFEPYPFRVQSCHVFIFMW